MNTDRMIAHVTFKFGLRRQGGYGVNDNHGHRTRAHKCVNDFKRLFTSVGLRNKQFIKVNAKLFSIAGVKRMFRINEGTNAALFLFFRHAMKGQRCFTRTFRPINFNDTTLRDAANAKCYIQTQRSS